MDDKEVVLLPWGIRARWVNGDACRGRFSVYGAVVVGLSPLAFRLSPDSLCLPSSPCLDFLSPHLVELGAGFGGMGIGAAFLGGITKVSVDFNGLACQHLRRNEHGHIMQMDLNHPDAARAIHTVCQGEGATIAFGFPCQPFSSQGAQRRMEDGRTGAFWKGLNITWQIQAQALILECVAQAGQEEQVQQGIHMLAKAMDWVVLQTQLELSFQWPCRRRRWWALLLPRQWHSKGLGSWQQTPHQITVGMVLNTFGCWDEAAESELQLTQDESEHFMDPTFGCDKRWLEKDDVASTILHSYSNVLNGCPCGCRAGGFHENSLRTKGVRGFCIPSAVNGAARHLHHRELAALLAVPDRVSYEFGPRTNNCLLGLVASPMQMIWIYSSLIDNCADRVANVQRVDPQEAVDAYKHELMRQLRENFPFAKEGIQKISLKSDKGYTLHIVAPQFTTSSQLLKAERIVLAWGQGQRVFDERKQVLPDDTHLQSGGPYLLENYDRKQPREQPTGILAISICHEGRLMMGFAQPGDFIFQVLRELDILFVNFLVDGSGRLFGADHRLWRSLQLTTLASPRLGTPIALCDRPPRGCQSGTTDIEGLSVAQVSFCVRSFLAQFGACLKNQIFMVAHETAENILRSNSGECLLRDQAFESPGEGELIVCIVAISGHWICLGGIVEWGVIHWTLLDGFRHSRLLDGLRLSKAITSGFGLEMGHFHSSSWIDQAHPWTCGTVALVHCCMYVGMPGIFSNDQVSKLHDWILDHVPAGGIVAKGLSGQADIQVQLAHLLHEHGVPLDASRDRARLVIDKLGLKCVQEAFKNRNPWARLKSEASKPNVMLRLVNPAELTQHVGTC